VKARTRIAATAACALALMGEGVVVHGATIDARPVRPVAATTELATERLSDEERITRVANAVLRAPVYRQPTAASPLAGRLRLQTEDGPLEVYLVLESTLDSLSRVWLRVRLPKRPNGGTGWVTEDALSDLRVLRTKLRIDRRTLRATLYRDGRSVWTSRIGIGAARTPTPVGRYWIRSRLRNLRGNSAYGPWAFGTAAYSVISDWPGGGVVGVHGTNQPGLIPSRPSHGCIRVPNAKIRRLALIMPIGTPMQVV
jgi:L,D-transpeptidase-like protein